MEPGSELMATRSVLAQRSSQQWVDSTLRNAAEAKMVERCRSAQHFANCSG